MKAKVSIVNFFLHRPPGRRPFACVPMGPMYLCAALERSGRDVEFLDYQLEQGPDPYDPRAIGDFLLKSGGDVVGVSAMSNMLPFLLLGLRRFKKRRPEAVVVLGGPATAGFPVEVLSAFPEVDAIVSGEGEQAVVSIADAFERGGGWSRIPGLTYRRNGEIRTSDAKNERLDVNTLPLPAHHLLRRDRYLNFPLLTSRGCPYACSFCDISPNWRRRVAFRDIQAVLAEVDTLHERFGAKAFSILDDIFILDRRRVAAFCDGLRQRPVSYEWACMCRVDLLEDELIENLKEAGCSKIFLGIESGSDRVRRIAGKDLRINNVAEVIAKASKHFEVAASFIIGFPFESLDEFRETLMLALYSRAQGARPQFCVLSPMPQAQLTKSGRYELAFDREVVSGMAYSRYEQNAASLLEEALTGEVSALIQDRPDLFSAFHHFKDGQVRKKLDLARSYGLCV